MKRPYGDCCWVGTLGELLSLKRNQFVDAMVEGTVRRLGNGDRPNPSQRQAWRDELKHLKKELALLPAEMRSLHIVFEYVLPGHQDRETGEVEYCKIPDAMIFGRSGVLVLEFKQREAPPFEGFAKETRGYLRLLEKWHRRIPSMSAYGALVLTHAMNFRKRFPRVKAISPDKIHSLILSLFRTDPTPLPDPAEFLRDVQSPEKPESKGQSLLIQ